MLAATIRGPLLLARDFNVIHYISEKKGSTRINKVYKLFNDCCFINKFCLLIRVRTSLGTVELY